MTAAVLSARPKGRKCLASNIFGAAGSRVQRPANAR